MATKTATRTVKCPNCGRLDRVPAAAHGKPRCGHWKTLLPWIADAGDEDFAEIAERATIPVLVDFWAAWCGRAGWSAPRWSSWPDRWPVSSSWSRLTSSARRNSRNASPFSRSRP